MEPTSTRKSLRTQPQAFHCLSCTSSPQPTSFGTGKTGGFINTTVTSPIPLFKLGPEGSARTASKWQYNQTKTDSKNRTLWPSHAGKLQSPAEMDSTRKPITKRIRQFVQPPSLDLPPLMTSTDRAHHTYALSPAAKVRRSYYMNVDRLCVGKGEITQILGTCKELYNRGASQAYIRTETVKKLIDRLQNQFTLSSAEVGEMIRTRAMKQLKGEVAHLGALTIEDIANELEAAARKTKEKGKNQPKYTFIESVERDIMNARTNPDDVQAILAPVGRTEVVAKAGKPSGYVMDGHGRVVDIKHISKTFTNGINGCIKEADKIKARVDAMAAVKDSRKEMIIRLEKALIDGSLKEVCVLVDKDPSLINYRFSLKESPLFIACKLGHERIVAALLERGAERKSKDFLGRSCKEIALRNHKMRIAQMLGIWDVRGCIPPEFFNNT